MKVNTKCPYCKKVTVLEMTDSQYYEYCLGNKYIQDIFPDWTSEEREMLITGICPDCWNKIFKNEE